MEESEQALEDAADGPSVRASRIAQQVLGDARTHRMWESRHAELVRPIAEENRRAPQILQLRKLETKLLHQRSLVDYIRKNQVTGLARDRLFKAFYGPKEVTDAVIREHRQYVLAESSHFSADHLFGVMADKDSDQLLSMYESAYSSYFSLYCFFVSAHDSVIADAIGIAMKDAHDRVKRLRNRLLTQRPQTGKADFDRQAALARSGRYPVLNYVGR